MYSMPNAVEKIEQLERECELQTKLLEILETEYLELARKCDRLQKQLEDLQSSE